jgi:iron-sulfur cluster assembly protein
MAGIDWRPGSDHMTDMTDTKSTPATSTPASKPKPRPRPQVMKLTEAAAQRIQELTRRADSEIVGLRVGVKNGGCAGQSYTVEYAHEIRPTDEVVEDRGVKILVDPKAVLFLLGTEMDYRADKLQAQFIFNNPNQISACGCGESVQLKPAKI